MDLFINTKNRIHMKKLAVNTCVSFLARTISQSQFRVKDNDNFIKNELWYKLNFRPNNNQTASSFWEDAIDKLINKNECLIIPTDTDDLVVADSFERKKSALYEDIFTGVTIGDFKYERSFKQSDVIHLQYRRENVMKLIESLADDYVDLFTSIMVSQKRKNQIRAKVKMEAKTSQKQDNQKILNSFIDKTYKAFTEKDVAIVPEQEGMEYTELSNGSNGGQSIDEINKVTNGYFDQVAMAIGIPRALIHGEMADVEKQTKNYMLFVVKPLLDKIEKEFNGKFFSKQEIFDGKHLEVVPVSYYDIVDIAASIDKLISSGFATGNEVRLEVGWERSEDPNLDKHYITKNYTQTNESDVETADEGGDNDNGEKD
ncbi:phage portal protein [Priestia megaterium]|nr:phage portal protein [Priestia megaterium]PGR01367.1 phage portal protein [Priestia megaterium]